jgi:serine/threonine-protein kinase
MSEVSAKSFLNLLQKSGLCDAAELKASLDALRAASAGGSVSLRRLTSHLLQSGLLTQWHVKKLMAGKYKGFFLGKYKLLGHLGTGGMSTVYLAEHTLFRKQRAIKVLPRDRVADRSWLQRFYREGRAAAALNHRNIVRVYDIGNEGDTHYLVMEYVRGQDVEQMVRQTGPLPCGQAVDFMIQTLSGLQHAHEHEMVHRDIKPANLLVTPEGEVKILDLGLALFEEDGASLTMMHNERILGTADYLSPEQAIDSHRVDPRSDIYSAGCTLYFMLTGQPPFSEGTIAQRIAMHQSRKPRDVSEFRTDCPVQLLEVVRRMMSKKPDDRFQGCERLIAELRTIGSSLPATITDASLDAGNKAARPAFPDTAPPGAPAVATTEPADSRRTMGSPRETSGRPAATRPQQQPRRSPTAANPPAGKSPSGKPPVDQPPVDQPPASKQSAGKLPASKPPAGKQTASTVPVRPTTAPPPATHRVGKADAASRRGPRQRRSPEPEKSQASTPATGKADTGPAPQRKKPEKRAASPKAASQAAAGPSFPAVVAEEPSKSGPVDVQQLRSFVAQHRADARRPVRLPRRPAREQMLLAGLVIAMLLLLGLVLWLALRFAS